MSAYRAVTILAISRGLQVVAGFLTIKLATTLFSPAQLGSMNQVMSLAVLGTSAVLLPVSAYIARALMEWMDAGVLKDKLNSYLLLAVWLGLLFGLLTWFLQKQTNLVSSVTPAWVGALVALYAVGYSVHVMGSSGLNLLGYRGLYVIFGNVSVWGGLLLAVVLSQLVVAPEMWLLGMYCGFVLATPSFWLLVRHCNTRSEGLTDHVPPSLVFDRWTVFTFVWPQSVTFVLWWIQSQSYRFVLSNVTDIAQVGLFATGYMICSVPMQTFESIFNELYSPEFLRRLKGQDAAGMASVWNAYASAYIPAVILFGAFLIGSSTFFVELLLGPQFHTIASILVWPALTETLRATSSSLHQLGLAKVDMTVNLLPVGVAALIAPPLVYMLAPYEPLLGTALALLVAGLASLVLVLPTSLYALPVTWPVRRIAAAIICGLLLILIGKSLHLLFPNPAPQDALIALFLSAAVMVVLQYGFAKKWMHKIARPVEVVA